MENQELPPASEQALAGFGRYLDGGACAVCTHTARLPLRPRKPPGIRRLRGRHRSAGTGTGNSPSAGWGPRARPGCPGPPWPGDRPLPGPSPPGRCGKNIIDADPALRLKAPKAERSLPGVLQPQQLVRLLTGLEQAAAEGSPMPVRNRAMVELLYATGLRVGELAGLDVDDLDPDRRTLRVIGKGNKERTVPYGVPAALAVDDWLRRGRPLAGQRAQRAGAVSGLRGGRVDQRQVRTRGQGPLRGLGGHLRHRARTRCGTRRPHTCWTAARTSVRCRKSWATAAWPPPRSTPTCRWTGSGRATSRPTRGPDGHRVCRSDGRTLQSGVANRTGVIRRGTAQ